MSRRLADLTWPDLVDDRPVLVVPIGSTEQHGPHLPVDTDTRIAVAVARSAVAAASDGEGGSEPTDLVLAPALPYGASGEHEGFPGTVSIGQEALRLVLIELARSATRWVGRIAFVNGHGGNLEPLVAAVRLLRTEGRDVTWFPCAFPGADAHAGATETSVLLALEPDRVQRSRIEPGTTAPLATILDRMRSGGVGAVSRNGVLGDPTAATAELGGRLVEALGADLARALAQWNPDETGRLR
ncbi:mycofactocin biosynthesis peptidyl-dipeptidase MftE [Tsukamurella spumae]|uniref:Mycofactocin biosynthesis peptidyl-dipeptidase MftE n=1 Tax=Tsukamurella spumae TaxID=44753 RepID=A0A846X3B8_9ACTN|nr:mycofactocin biosynthesis peptidyl-dipeptidase MftE [Tsukamurella spumae]NKY20117.1 mycofactocin biosynthesis peptidyl-dipeptidase MftE [Tsukamurella spumae]